MALPSKKVLNLEDVKNNFNDYNFIISLNGVTIDTEKYISCNHQQTQLAGVCANGTKHLVLSSAKQSDWNNTPAKGESRVLIFDNCVQEIKVKSKKNFLNK